jgi:hypothetical protein
LGNTSRNTRNEIQKSVCYYIPFFSVLYNISGQWDDGNLKISENRHFLVHEDGAPFYWIGNTAWEMAHFSKREEVDLFLKNRHENAA